MERSTLCSLRSVLSALRSQPLAELLVCFGLRTCKFGSERLILQWCLTNCQKSLNSDAGIALLNNSELQACRSQTTSQRDLGVTPHRAFASFFISPENRSLNVPACCSSLKGDNSLKPTLPQSLTTSIHFRE